MNAKPSKSAQKREAKAVEALGERLLTLTDEQLAGLPLDDDLREVVATTRDMHARSALRRQRLFLARKLRAADVAAVAAAVDRIDGDQREQRRLFHQAEQWRDRLLAEGNYALAALQAQTGRDNARLDELLRGLQSSLPERQQRRLGREIFREIHRELTAVMQNGNGNG